MLVACRSFCVILLASVSVGAFAAPPQPIEKDGSCPSRYNPSGDYCVPQQNATHAIAKIGSCPTGYRPSGNYCLANSADSDLAIVKSGSCPTGFRPAGNYCLSNR